MTTVVTSSPENKIESNLITYFLLITVVMFWGASWPAGKIVSQNLPPITAAFFRFTIALPFFFAAALYIDKDISIPKNMHPKIAVLGLLQVTLYNICFLTGLKYTSSSDAVLIIGTNPTITAIIASRLYEDEKFTKNKILGLIVAMIGVAIVVEESPNTQVPDRLLGNLIILGAATTWATFTAFSRPMVRKIKPLTFTAWASLYGWVGLMFLSPLNGSWFIEVSRDMWIALAYLALAAGVYGNIFYNSGVRKLGASRTSIFVNFVPIFGILSALVILPNEKFSWWYVVSLVLILSGVFLVNRKPKSKLPSNPP